MMRGIYGDDERYKQTYWSRFPHKYLAGDGCNRDPDGDYWFMGRIDDVMNISGHRISTAEVESALVDHPTSPRPRSSAGTTTLPVRRSRRSSRSSHTPTARRNWPTSCARTSRKSSASSCIRST